MTVQEAVETIEKLKNIYPVRYNTSIDMAIESLKKQVPTKSISAWRCPQCRLKIPWKDIHKYTIISCPLYSSSIDWSKEEK